MTVLRTARLTLRPAEWEDAPDLHAVFGDPCAMRYWSTPPHEKLVETEGFIAGMISQTLDTGEDFVVECEGTVIGKAGFWRWPEIGYILHPDHWRKGYASEAIAALAAHAFAKRGLAAITADIDPRNVASIGLLTGLGFRETGRAERTIEVAGEWCDSIYYQLDAPAEMSADGTLPRG